MWPTSTLRFPVRSLIIVVALPDRSANLLTMVAVPMKKLDWSAVMFPLMMSSIAKEIPHCIVWILSVTVEALVIPELAAKYTWDTGSASQQQSPNQENNRPQHLALRVE